MESSKKPKVLWVPHWTLFAKNMMRENHLIEQIQDDFDIHVLEIFDVKSANNLIEHGEISAFPAKISHQTLKAKFHLLPRMFLCRFALSRKINENYLVRKLKKLHQKHNFDLIIYSAWTFIMGKPDLSSLKIPVLFDFLDELDPESMDFFCKQVDKFLVVSRNFEKLVKNKNQETLYLPNGFSKREIDPSKLSALKNKLGLNEQKVVGFIGLTMEEEDFYLPGAIIKVLKERQGVKFLIVGDGEVLPRLKSELSQYEDRIIFTGFINPQEVGEYFALCDVGLYPGGSSDYFYNCSPLKVFEHLERGSAVVTCPLSEFECYEIPNIFYSKPNSNDFAINILEALKFEPKPYILDGFSWPELGRVLASEINRQIAR